MLKKRNHGDGGLYELIRGASGVAWSFAPGLSLWMAGASLLC